jgi:hypothetical protein
VARRLRQWRRCWGQRGCADRYHHYFQLLDSNTNTNSNSNSNGNSVDADSDADGNTPTDTDTRGLFLN